MRSSPRLALHRDRRREGSPKPGRSAKTMMRLPRVVVLAAMGVVGVSQEAPVPAELQFQQVFGSGQVASPFGTAVDSAGNLYVNNFVSSGTITEFESHLNYVPR